MKISLYTEGVISLPFHDITRRKIKHLVKKTCALLKLKNAQPTVVLCDNKFIKQINKDYRKTNKPTDVISFPGNSFSFTGIKMKQDCTGEIYISLEKAFENAGTYGNTFTDEVKWLIVHGILHLTGYDHERSPEDEKRMGEKEEEILKML